MQNAHFWFPSIAQKSHMQEMILILNVGGKGESGISLTHPLPPRLLLNPNKLYIILGASVTVLYQNNESDWMKSITSFPTCQWKIVMIHLGFRKIGIGMLNY